MKKTILCTVIGSVFSLNASAAVLDVKGEIRVNGTTALATVNLNNYMAPSGTTQIYTVPDCSYGPDGKVCGIYTKTVTITRDGATSFTETEVVKNPQGDIEYSYVTTRNGSDFSEQGESRSKGSYSNYVDSHWADANGEPITINGVPVNEGTFKAECQVEDPSTVEGCSDDPFWHPDTANGDHWVDGYQKEIHYVDVRRWDETWTGIELTPRNDNYVVMGVPTSSIWKNTSTRYTSTSWREIDGVKESESSDTTIIDSGIDDDTFTVTGKIPVYNGYNDCIAVVVGDDEFRIQCANVGTVFEVGNDHSNYREWTLVSQ